MVSIPRIVHFYHISQIDKCSGQKTSVDKIYISIEKGSFNLISNGLFFIFYFLINFIIKYTKTMFCCDELCYSNVVQAKAKIKV